MAHLERILGSVLKVVLLLSVSTVSIGSVDAAPTAKSDIWAPPFVLRVISENEKLGGRLITQPGLGVEIDTLLSLKQDLDSAYPIYPSGDPFAPAFSYPNSTELYEQQYHSTSNSSELILIYGYKPQNASGVPVLYLSTDYGPGITHYWPAGTTVASWRGWRFVRNEDDQTVRLRQFGDTTERWIAWQYMNGRYSVGRWNGTTPAKNTGWPSSLYELLDTHINIDLEVVPLKSLLEGNN